MPGMMLAPGEGRRITGGGMQATLKVAGGQDALTSTFEVVVPAGYDVGAHVHSTGEELFYVVQGILDVLAFEPVERTADWHDWESTEGRRYLRGGPGSLLFVSAGCPHAFANLSAEPVTMLFQSAPSGHEDYFEELATLLRDSGNRPDPTAMIALRTRYDIAQITSFRDHSKP